MQEHFFLWAHRGASAAAPENTLAAFRLAEVAGADGIELDVHLSRDGVPVVIHDADVKRTTGGRGAVSRMLLQELKRLDAGSWFGSAFFGERVPTLVEVLEWAQGRLMLNVEIKSADSGQAVLALLCDHPAARVVVSSFNHSILGQMRHCAPELPLAFLIETRFWGRALKRAAACGAKSVHPRWDLVSCAMVDAAHRLRLKVYPWTVNEPDRLYDLRRMGVDGIFTDNPGTLFQVLKNTEQREVEDF